MDHYHRSYMRQLQMEDGQYLTETRTTDLTAVILGFKLGHSLD